MSNYGIDEIKSLSTLEGFRTRPQMYVGSNDIEGTYQAFKEIVNNSTDEALVGYGDKITIIVNEKENSISVEDEGRGIPFGIRENGENVLVSIYTGLHVGGKFDKKAYANSSGMNGCGGSAVCAMSEYFIVTSYKDGKTATATFKKGVNIFYKEEKTQHSNGTYVKFKPDVEVFSLGQIGYSYERICEEIHTIAYLNKKVHFIVINEETNEKREYYSQNGIADFIKDKATKPLMKAPIICSVADETDEIEIAFIWTGDTGASYTFVNGLYTPEPGSPVTGAKTAITNSIKKLSGKSFDPALIRKGLVYAINCKVANPSFANQTKSKINNPNLRTLASQAFKQGLEEFANTSDFSKIIDLMERFQKAEKAADKARESILNQNKEITRELKKKTVLAGKLADCRYHDEKSQLIIVEGLSALGGIVKSRNSDYTAAFPLTGKILNVLKSTEEQQGENEVLKNLHTAIGSGYGANFSEKKLRYGRIVFVCDSDEDGYSIMCLLLAFMYKYYPNLLKKKKVFWGQTPLFKVTTKQNKIYYAYNEQELKQLPKGDILRAKGIGELEAEDFKKTLFSEHGRYIPFTFEDAEKAYYYFDVLLGENIEERKNYISINADFDAFD